MIEKFDLLQQEADKFENTKKDEDNLAIVIVSIGMVFRPETDDIHRIEAKKFGIVKPKRAKDGSDFF